MAVYCMLVTTPCNEGCKGDMFWTKNTPYDGVVWEVAQSTPEANFAELPRHTGYFFGWGYSFTRYGATKSWNDLRKNDSFSLPQMTFL